MCSPTSRPVAGDRSFWRVVLVLATTVLSTPLVGCWYPPAAPPPVPPAGTPPAAESHDATARHSFADIAHWTKVFDDPARDTWQKPQAVVDMLDLRPGMCVADLGAGTGYFSRYLSAAVGDTGTVLAVDTEVDMVVHLRARAEQERTTNVVPILASADNPRLPVAAVDVILIVDTIHHIDDRINYLRQLRRFLKRRGRVAVIDWKKEALPLGPPPAHKLAAELVIGEFRSAGYELVAQPTLLPYHYFLVFQAR